MLVACRKCRRQYDVTGIAVGESVRCRCGLLVKVPAEQPHEARLLHCGGCGAALKEAAEACAYCKSPIPKAERHVGPPCPECFARLGKGAKFCNECGVKIESEAMRATRATAKCPRCAGAMVLMETPKAEFTECAECGGLWLGPQAFDRLLNESKRSQVDALLGAATGRDRREFTPDPYQAVQYVPCLVCAQLMNRRMFGGNSGVVIDWCRGHGFWFDPDELQKVLNFARSGGAVERERADARSAPLQEKPSVLSPQPASPSSAPADPDDPVGQVVRAIAGLFIKGI